MASDRPVLWHLPVSHYSEKVRWALDLKGIEHERRAPVPGAHIAIALAFTRGRSVTFPILELDGRRIADSTAIIAALEEGRPDPPLYPADAEQRRRALELEDTFDETLGPAIRRYVFHELAKDPAAFARVAQKAAPPPLDRVPRITGLYARSYAAARFRTRDPEKAQAAREDVMRMLDLVESELGAGDHLVGGTFSVADLTAAALFYPLLLPPGGPIDAADQPPEVAERREELLERRGARWVHEVYARYRKPAAVPAGV